jgi:hypothetical protein
MINILAALKLAGATISKEDAAQLVADVELLYPLIQPFKAGQLDFAEMAKAGTLRPAVEALSRSVSVMASVIAEKPNEQALAELLASLPTA